MLGAPEEEGADGEVHGDGDEEDFALELFGLLVDVGYVDVGGVEVFGEVGLEGFGGGFERFRGRVGGGLFGGGEADFVGFSF